MNYSKLPLNRILLSCDNPRLEQSFNEMESIKNMIEDQNEKLIVLVKDIIDNGLSPIDTIAVVPSDDYKNYYEVCEGNRRICVLKILQNPALIKEVDNGLFKKFSDLASTSCFNFDEINVCVFNNKDDLSHWLEIKHMGEQGGKGLSKWNSIQKDRFKRSVNGSDLLLDFWDWLIEEKILTYDEIHSITKTNWQRILRECYFPFMKIQRRGDMYYVEDDNIPIFVERIRCIQKHLAGQTVAVVYDKSHIDDFFDIVSNELYQKSYCKIVEQENAEQLSIELGEYADLSEVLSDTKKRIKIT